jgi:hypothetical protein
MSLFAGEVTRLPVLGAMRAPSCPSEGRATSTSSQRIRRRTHHHDGAGHTALSDNILNIDQ